MPSFSTLLQHQEHFNSELVCIQYLEQRRWNGIPSCPHCGSLHHYRTTTRFKSPELAGYKDFKCKECRKKYTTLTGTIYESSKVSLRTWFAAVYLMTAHKKGISSHQLARDLGVCQKTAWFMLQRIRAMIVEKQAEKLSGTVQADETFVGGKNKNRHHDKKVPQSQGRSHKDKTPVMGVLQENEYGLKVTRAGNLRRYIITPSKVRTRVVADTKASTIQPHIRDMVEKGSILVSDEWIAYHGLSSDYDHRIVDHRAKEYVNESGDTSNALEGHWSQFKRGIIGIYHQVSRKHLHRYCAEFDYRHNRRLMGDAERFKDAVEHSGNARLSYRALTG